MAKDKQHDELPVGLPKNFVRACLLLLVREEPSHGYDLLERMRAMGIGRVDPGGLYRALRAMEQEGLMLSVWQTSDIGPARRTYELTQEGEDWLHAWAATLRQSQTVLAGYLERYDKIFSNPVPVEG